MACGAQGDVYCERIDEMKALVEPLPLVPAMWTGLSRSKSAGCMFSQSWA